MSLSYHHQYQIQSLNDNAGKGYYIAREQDIFDIKDNKSRDRIQNQGKGHYVDSIIRNLWNHTRNEPFLQKN